MKFGERIRGLRREKKLDQRALAAAVGVSFTYISKIANEKLDFGDFPSEALILRLASALQADADELWCCQLLLPGAASRTLTISGGPLQLRSASQAAKATARTRSSCAPSRQSAAKVSLPALVILARRFCSSFSTVLGKGKLLANLIRRVPIRASIVLTSCTFAILGAGQSDILASGGRQP
ncbi:MAG: helix-turn-helix domain-containing protein, partial [Gemmataceae bacterium]